MQVEELNELLNKGREAVEKGYIPSAQVFFSQIAEQHNTPEVRSYLAYCLAKSQGRTQAAAKTCIESIRREPDNPTHYLLLGRIHLLTDDKEKAVQALRQGANINKDQRILNELSKLGMRKAPVIKSLKRNHPVNRILGKIFAQSGLR
jgi:tetratricopeptide (TPR) repeat protein